MVHAHAGFWILLAGVVVFAGEADCLRGSALVAELKAKAKAALLNPTETVEEVVTVDGDNAGNGTTSNVTVAKTKSLLTGNPQKDYIYDPNLPRELNGYNLTNYPFYNGVPDDIDFKCDDLHDGFYASVPHKCQVYHHCLFGTRYDFLCANYTAFDQRTFICHFVSEVDCDNSPKFYQRNEALYKEAATTSPPIVLMTTTTTAPPSTTAPQPQRPRRRRPYRRRRPVYEYYYDDQYDDDEYYDDDPPPPRRKMNRKHRPQGGYRDDEDDYYDGRRDSSRGENSRGESSRGDNSRGEGSRGEGSRGDGFSDSSKEGKATLRVSGPASGTVYDRPRVPPKIRRPVPIHERDKYDYTQKTSDGGPPPTQDPKKGSKSANKPEEEEDEYYDDDYEDDYVKPLPKRGKTGSDYEPGSKSDSRRPVARHRPRQQPRRRPDRYDDDYDVGRPAPRKRPRHEDPPQSSRGSWAHHRGHSREEPDAVPAERPGFISSGRFSSGNRKRADDDRSQMAGKRPSTRVVYDDEEEDEEYYDDEEDDAQDEGANQRNQKPTSSHSGSNGRRNDGYESESGRKYLTSNRKQSSESPKPTSRSDTRMGSGSFQGDNARSENGKPQSRQKPETTSYSRGTIESDCKNGCEEDYSDETVIDSRQENRKGIDRESQKRNNDRDSQKQNSERDRVFSSRFKEPQSDSKTKQQSYSSTGPGRSSSPQTNYRTTTQTPDPPQRSKPQSRTKPDVDELPVTPKPTPTPTTTVSSEDYSDESSTSSSGKYSNFRSKSRVVPPTPLINNYKPVSTTEEPYETSEVSNSNQSPEIKAANVEESVDFEDDRTVISPRPFSGAVRRPIKPTTEAIIQEETPVSAKTTFSDLSYRQTPSVTSGEDDKAIRKLSNPGQNYRRVKIDPLSYENRDYNQQKAYNVGSNFRRPIKPVEEYNPDDVPSSEGSQNANDNLRKGNKPDKTQNEPGYGVYRRVKVSAISSPAPELEVLTSTSENPQSLQGEPMSNPVNNYKRPYLVAKPLSNYPVVVEDTTKNNFPSNGPFRRPIKQRIQDDGMLAGEQFNPASASSGIGENYHNAEPALPVNLRPNLGYFPPKRGKIRIDENSATGLEQFPKQLNLNQEDQFSKQSPKIEITAPGPSAPDVDIATVKSNYKNDYNNAPPGFSLDIPEEEYDVTLNDALQPSTLHPTRSLVDYQQNRLKTRDYQSSIGRSPEYVNRGRVSYLLPAASQQYITRVQTVYSPEKQEEAPITARYTDKNSKKGPSLDQEEYEAVVLTAPNAQWANQRRNRPTEWFW